MTNKYGESGLTGCYGSILLKALSQPQGREDLLEKIRYEIYIEINQAKRAGNDVLGIWNQLFKRTNTLLVVKVFVNICQKRASTNTGQTRHFLVVQWLRLWVSKEECTSWILATILTLICGVAETESDSYGLNRWGEKESECVDVSEMREVETRSSWQITEVFSLKYEAK